MGLRKCCFRQSGGDGAGVDGIPQGPPTAFVSATNAVELDYEGIAYGKTVMTEDTTASFTGIAEYAQVVLLIVGDDDTAFDLTWPAGTFVNTADGDLTVGIAADTKTWALIYHDGDDSTYVVTMGDPHVVGI